MNIKHEGLHTHRLKSNPREKVFAEAWRTQCETAPGKPNGTLTYLLCVGDQRYLEPPTQEQSTIAATVIQWLGSPVGFSFLEECLKKCEEEGR